MFGLFASDKKTDTKKAQEEPAVPKEGAATTVSAKQPPASTKQDAPQSAVNAPAASAPTPAEEHKLSGNLLMISNQRHRAFYERAARELLASGHEDIQLSALGNAVPLAVQVALSLQDKNAAILKKIETKDVKFLDQGDGRRRSGAPSHSSGVEIVMHRHPDFKGTRIVPGHVFFCPKSKNDETSVYPESPDLVFVSVNTGPADALFSSPDGIAFSSILKKAGQDVSADKKLHEHLFNECQKANQGIEDFSDIKFVGELTQIKAYNPDLKAAFVRIPFQGNEAKMTGSTFIHIFEDGKCPHKNDNNAAVAHMIAPQGSDYATAEAFLDAVELSAMNLMTTLCDYNGYTRRHSGAPRLRKLSVARVGLFSTEAGSIHPKATKLQVAEAILKGLDTGYHFGASPRLQFLNDTDEVIKKAWLKESGAEESSLQITDHIFRRSSVE